MPTPSPINLTGYGQSSLTNPIGVPSPTPSPVNNPAPTSIALAGATVTPTVVTPQAATKDLQGIQSNLQQTQDGIAAQAQKVAAQQQATQQQAAADAAAKAASDKSAADAALATAKTNALNGGYSPALTNQLNRATDQIQSTKTNPDGTTTVTYNDGTTQVAQGTFTGSTDATGSTGTGNSLTDAADTLSAQMLAQATAAMNTITGYQNGTIPLTSGEQAQVTGLQQQFQTLIDQQNLTNSNATGVANVRGYQTGAAEYDPTFQTKQMASIVAAGAQKVADLNVKMSSAVASLEQGFRDNDIKAVQDANAAYQDAAKSRLDEINKQADAVAAVAKDAADKKAAADAANTAAVNNIKEEVAKNGAPQSVLDAITKTGNVDAAIAASAGFLQTATGTLGDYLQYTRDAKAAGQTPVPYTAFQAEEDTLKTNQAVAQAGGEEAAKMQADLAAGQLPSSQKTIFDQINGDFTKSAESTQFQSAQDNLNIINAMTGTDPASQAAALAAFMQMVVPGAKTLRGSGSLLTSMFGNTLSNALISAERTIDDRGTLNPQDIASLKSAANILYGQKASSYDTTRQAYITQLQGNGIQNGDKMLLNLNTPQTTGQSVIQQENDAKTAVQSFVGTDPAKIDKMNSDASVLQKTLGRVPTATEFLQAYPEYSATPQSTTPATIGGFSANLTI